MSTTSLPERITENSALAHPPSFRKVLSCFESKLAQPYQTFKELVGPLLATVRQELRADTASLFLIDQENPKRLGYVAGVGYSSDRDNHWYVTEESALTPFVLRERTPYNLSKKQIDVELEKVRRRSRNGIPCTCPCKDYITTKQFLNVLAVPVVFDNYSLGVLKFENKQGTTERDKFPDADVEVAQLLAVFIAVLFQQRFYTRLTSQAESLSISCDDAKSYLRGIVRLLANAVNAECCCVFLKESAGADKQMLKNAGSIGYIASYADHVYELPIEATKAKSLTAYVAMIGEIMEMTEKELATLKTPYDRDCWRYFVSGSFRNTLVIPMGQPDCWGVLRVDNKRPEGIRFDKYDAAICKNFIEKQIMPTLERLRGKHSNHRVTSRGASILISQLGPPVREGDANFQERCKEVLELKRINKEITVHDCWRYLGFSSRATYYRHNYIKRVNGHATQTKAT